MRKPVALLPLLAVLGGAALVGPAAQAGSDPRTQIRGTHCLAGERVAYSCTLGRKIVSVCMGAERLAYRYGPSGKPELEILSNGHDGAAHWGYVTGGGGGSQEHIRFTNGEFHYIVYAGVQGSLHDNPGRRWSGLAVSRGDTGQTEVSTQDCGRNGALQALAPDLAQGRVDEETASGPFDAWY